ncbi:MAG: TIGR02453 family protein [Proteobacteria bacterium]|nr:TIGR02453 family protein [Pseudomonadota bacterium]
MAARREPYFTPATFRFLRALRRNNRREWFHAHKHEYDEHVREPSLRLIADLADPLRSISPQLVASPRAVGGSLFRIHRDTRFSSDKTPYKTHIGMSFYHAATKATARGGLGTADLGRLDAPVIYLHIEPGACFTGGGIWHPQPATLKRLRDFLIDNPRSWKTATRERKFTRTFELDGDSLSRPPRGYAADHELIADLMRKDFVASAMLEDDALLRPDLVRILMQRYRILRPLLDWLSASVELEF